MSDILITFPVDDTIVITFDAIPISDGGGSGSGSITVKESDDSPIITADTIIFPSGTVTDSGSGDATINPSGRYASGSSISLSNSFFGLSGSADTKWTVDKLVDFLLNNNSFINQWLDGTPFAAFALSDLYYNIYQIIGSSGNFTVVGGAQATSTGTLANAASQAYGPATRLTQASAASNGSLVFTVGTGVNTFLLRGNVAGVNGFLVFNVFAVEGSNWTETGASTGVRMVSGLFNSGNVATICGSDNPALERASFMRSNVNGGLTETNWMFSTRDATTENRVSTGVPFSSGGAVYASMIACAQQGGTIYYRIKDFTNNNDSTLLNTTSNLPQATTLLANTTGFRNVDAVSRAIVIMNSRAYVRNFIV